MAKDEKSGGILLAWRTIERLNPDVILTPRQSLSVVYGIIRDGDIIVYHTIFVVTDTLAKQMGVDMANFSLEPVAVNISLEIVG